MADYSEDVDGALEAITEDGGPIVFKIYPADNAPTDPNKDWEGSTTEREDFPHVALLVPLAGSDPKALEIFDESALIPGKGLTFEIGIGTQFETAKERYSVEAVNVLRPDGITPILYICKVSKWPLV